MPEIGLLLYGATRSEAIRKAEAAAREIVADAVAHGELPADALNASFAVSAT